MPSHGLFWMQIPQCIALLRNSWVCAEPGMGTYLTTKAWGPFLQRMVAGLPAVPSTDSGSVISNGPS